MDIITLGSGFILGLVTYHFVKLLMNKHQISIRRKEILSQFNQLIENIKLGKSKFKTRIKNTVLIETSLEEHGKVMLVLLLDKNEISIIKDDKCLYSSSEYLDSSKLLETISIINHFHGQMINDVVEVMGVKVSRIDLEKNIQQHYKQMNQSIKIDVIESNKDIKKEFDIDQILDKINLTGIESLTDEEIDYLKKFKS